MDFYSNEIDVLKSVVDEINHAYLSPISHLTPHLISEDKLSETIKEQNKILEKTGKKLGISLVNFYIPG